MSKINLESSRRPDSTQRHPYNRNRVKRLCGEADKQARRRAIEAQYPELKHLELDPVHPRSHEGTYNPPGYFRRGGLQGVLYTNKNRTAYA